MRLLGLSGDKWRQWREVLAEEGRLLTWRDWWGMIKLGLTIPFVAKRSLWRQRMRTCRKCPIFDPTLRRCRPFSGSPLGCGCWTPLTAMTRKRCWARQYHPEADVGWVE